ncbi:MAG TPA: hypothetical protein VJ964_12620 [Balneolaceae bacterium]|nr:hypothetical protein [Balneolaceae bacterium]
MLKKILSLIGFSNKTSDSGNSSQPQIDIDNLVQQIRDREKQNDIPRGKQIHTLEIKRYTVSLDREFTGKYRISIFSGPHKVFGFNIIEEHPTDEQLAEVFKQIIFFLTNNPSAKTLPESHLFKAHFFGNP